MCGCFRLLECLSKRHTYHAMCGFSAPSSAYQNESRVQHVLASNFLFFQKYDEESIMVFSKIYSVHRYVRLLHPGSAYRKMFSSPRHVLRLTCLIQKYDEENYMAFSKLPSQHVYVWLLRPLQRLSKGGAGCSMSVLLSLLPENNDGNDMVFSKTLATITCAPAPLPRVLTNEVKSMLCPGVEQTRQ
jgi:hypothetical protein